ncbi:hypothetical protein BH11PLA2_BH11PLA2_23310 [soil metagenome]
MIDFIPPAIVCPVDDLTQWIIDGEGHYIPTAEDLREMDLAHTAMHPAVARLIEVATAVVDGAGQYDGDLRDLWQAVLTFKNVLPAVVAHPAAAVDQPATFANSPF